MELLIQYWDLLLIIVLAIVGLGYLVYKFLSQPSSAKKEQIRAVLLELVLQAEAIYGSQTGKVKFSMVYGMLVERFKWLQYVPLSVVEALVEEALEEMRHLLETNPQVAKLIVKE